MSTINSTNVEDFGKRLVIACRTDETAEIARLLEVSYQSAKNYLEGRLPAAEVLITIAHKTGVSLNWLLTGEGLLLNRSISEQSNTGLAVWEDKWALRVENVEIVLRTPKGKDVSLSPEIVIKLNNALLELAKN